MLNLNIELIFFCQVGLEFKFEVQHMKTKYVGLTYCVFFV